MKIEERNKIISTFPERLKLIMDIKGIRGSKLAQELGIHKSLIYKYLSGVASPLQDRFQQIADYFNVSYAWLLGYNVEMYKDNIKNKVIKELENLNDDQLTDVYLYIVKNFKVKK